MGNLFSSIWASMVSNQEMRILMLGLDAAGKTTLLYKFHVGEVVNTLPTIGFNVETVEYKNINFTVWDVGGQDKIRPLWKHYYQGTQGIIFVVDSNDRDRVDESAGYQHSAKEELAKLLQADELQDAAILVFANKQDLPGAMKAKEVADRLGLSKGQFRGRDWHVQPTNAISGDGMFQGLDWLSATLSKRRTQASH